MQFIPITTRALRPPQDDIYPVLDKYLPKLRDGDVLFITSKILAIHQGLCLPVETTDKLSLIKQEADSYATKPVQAGGKKIYLTIKQRTLIASGGIDESNGEGYYVLWPRHINALLKEVWQHLRRKHRIKKLGVVTTDSHITPMRLGTSGISIGFYGIEPVRDYRGKPDIFGRKLKYTQANIVDGLSATAVLLMGEGRETRPLIVARGVPDLKFTDRPTMHKLTMPLERDIYYPLLKPFRAHAKTKIPKKKSRIKHRS